MSPVQKRLLRPTKSPLVESSLQSPGRPLIVQASQTVCELQFKGPRKQRFLLDLLLSAEPTERVWTGNTGQWFTRVALPSGTRGKKERIRNNGVIYTNLCGNVKDDA